MKLDIATGYYVNVYERGGIDVYIIINEPNDEPTSEEVGLIDKVVVKAMTEIDENNTPMSTKEKECYIEEALLYLDCNCLAFGYNIIVRE